ncbi:MAG: sulfurtransferase TusA family protein [Rhodospirillales bacterium]|nr:MAG: sulfurtransferase TusA family protein [Rhodospirillales bacterium]
MADTILDASGLQCPLPVLRANRALRPLAAGDRLTVIATDPSAPADFRQFCRQTGHDLVESTAADGVFTIVLRKAVPAG